MIDKQAFAEKFERDGFVVVRNAIGVQSLAELKNAAIRIVDDFDMVNNRTTFTTKDRDSGRDDYFFESAEAINCFLEEDALDADGNVDRAKRLAINKIGHAMHDLDATFGAFCRLPIFKQVLTAIGYKVPVLYQSMYIFKQPQIGGEVRWHQDASYLQSDGRGVAGVWVAVENANVENGCLWVQPGQHRSPLREIYEVDWNKRRGELRTLDETPWCSDPDSAIPLEVSAGTVIFFSDRMPHYSSQNRSTRSRHAFTLHVAERYDNWSPSNWLQRPSLGDFMI
ncbi:MAG: phytanoyl-CoA dioxygenase family protein [Woeseiaceae bacterium]